jgi:hypothetical protein
MAAHCGETVVRGQGAPGATAITAQQVLQGAIAGEELLSVAFRGVAAGAQRAADEAVFVAVVPDGCRPGRLAHGTQILLGPRSVFPDTGVRKAGRVVIVAAQAGGSAVRAQHLPASGGRDVP